MTDKEELRQRLTPEEFAVTQENATEAPFTGKYDDFYEKGIYVDVLVGSHCLPQRINMMQAVVGRPSVNQFLAKTSKKKLISPMACIG